MRRLRDSTGESINLGLADLGDIVFVTQVESRETMRAIGKPGFRAPLHGTAMGQSILAAMAEDDVLQYLRTYGLPKLTNNTIARASRLHETLGEVRRAGHAIDDEQNAVGLRCIAAAIRDEHGRPFGGDFAGRPDAAHPEFGFRPARRRGARRRRRDHRGLRRPRLALRLPSARSAKSLIHKGFRSRSRAAE